MLTMPGIPSIYYGTEQAFDGGQDYHDYDNEPKRAYIERYIRECMFGVPFGAFGTAGRQFFNPQHLTVYGYFRKWQRKGIWQEI